MLKYVNFRENSKMIFFKFSLYNFKMGYEPKNKKYIIEYSIIPNVEEEIVVLIKTNIEDFTSNFIIAKQVIKEVIVSKVKLKISSTFENKNIKVFIDTKIEHLVIVFAFNNKK